MTPHARVPGAVVLVLGIALASAGGADDKDTPWKPVLPEAAFATMVGQDAKLIQDVLAKGKPDKRTEGKVRTVAVMVAVYAQSNMGRQGADAKQMAGLRDTALKVVAAIDKADWAAAKKHADALAPAYKGDAGKPDPVPLQTHVELQDAMHQFSIEKTGGFGIEKELEDLANAKQPLTPAQRSKLASSAYRAAMIAGLAEAHAPEKDMGKKLRKDWLKWSQDMRQDALGLAQLAEQAKGDKEVKAAIDKLTTTCNACHQVYRP